MTKTKETNRSKRTSTEWKVRPDIRCILSVAMLAAFVGGILFLIVDKLFGHPWSVVPMLLPVLFVVVLLLSTLSWDGTHFYAGIGPLKKGVRLAPQENGFGGLVSLDESKLRGPRTFGLRDDKANIIFVQSFIWSGRPAKKWATTVIHWAGNRNVVLTNDQRVQLERLAKGKVVWPFQKIK